MAGAGGIEPPNGGIKIRCLTAWLRPNRPSGRRGGLTPHAVLPATPVYRGSWAISTGPRTNFRRKRPERFRPLYNVTFRRRPGRNGPSPRRGAAQFRLLGQLRGAGFVGIRRPIVPSGENRHDLPRADQRHAAVPQSWRGPEGRRRKPAITAISTATSPPPCWRKPADSPPTCWRRSIASATSTASSSRTTR